MERSKRARERKLKTTTLKRKSRVLRERIQGLEQELISQMPFQLTVQAIVNLLLSKLPPAKEITKRGKLNLEERIELYRCKILARLSITQIAKRLKRSVSTISRELKRNRPLLKIHGMDCYSVAKHAQDKAELRKATKKHKERLKSQVIRNEVEGMLKTRMSPELISERLFLEKRIIVSHEAIYQWIYNERPELIEYLPRGAKKYHPRGSTKKSRKKKGQPAAPKTSIDLRPKRVSNRIDFGHWEMDTIVSKQSKECLFVLQERMSRYFFVVKLASCSAKLVKEAVIKLLKPLGSEWVKSITCDNGSENSLHAEITEELKIPIYFCHPYCASERGGVENRNGLLRMDFPKKTDFSLVTEAQLEIVRLRWLNRPMKCLAAFTPLEIFTNSYRPMFKMAA